MSKKYTVELAPAAERQLKKLVPRVRNSILTQIEMLQNHPRPHGVKKLSGMDDLYRIRVADYRIIYTISDKELIILVVKVGNRREVYR